MSTQINSSTTTATRGKGKEITCGACESVLEHDHRGITCVQGHHYCTGCSVNIVRLFFSEPENYIPLRCLQCHVELIPSVFERQLTPEQYEIYQHHMMVFVWAKNYLEEGERLDHCPFCTNAVIRNKYASNIFYCNHVKCEKVSCLICRKSCPKFEYDYGNDEDIEEMETHYKCAELADDKSILDQYIESGQKLPCPNCGLAGMKDDACTHMTCPKCSQLWCYFCGKRTEDCDKARDSNNGIFDHNHNWDRNPNRCPMYLTQVRDIDERWPEEEFECLAFFHRIRSLQFLREAYEKLGEQRINELDEHFNTVTTCGFTKDEILNEDLTLINRPNNR